MTSCVKTPKTTRTACDLAWVDGNRVTFRVIFMRIAVKNFHVLPFFCMLKTTGTHEVLPGLNNSRQTNALLNQLVTLHPAASGLTHFCISCVARLESQSRASSEKLWRCFQNRLRCLYCRYVYAGLQITIIFIIG